MLAYAHPTGFIDMVFSEIMQRFQAQAPIPVMAQALLERVLVDDLLDACFERVTQKQYTRELLFSSVSLFVNIPVAFFKLPVRCSHPPFLGLTRPVRAFSSCGYPPTNALGCVP